MSKLSTSLFFASIIIYLFSISFSFALTTNDDIPLLFDQIKGDAIFDFENNNLPGWQVEKGSVKISVSDKIKNPGINSRFLTTASFTNDNFKPKGTIKSPIFKLQKGYVSFLIAGGAISQRHLNIVSLHLENGKQIFKVNAPGSNQFEQIRWDASKYVGQNAFLRIVDNSDKSYTALDNFELIDSNLVASLLKQIEQKRQQNKAALMQDKSLFAPGSPTIYTGQNLSAIDFLLGGIGSGCIHIDGNAKRSVWEIFNQFSDKGLDNTFFAIRTSNGDSTLVKALQTKPVGPFDPMQNLSLKAEYPLACYTFQDPALPVNVSMETFNFLIPFDTKNSALPCVVFNFSVKNNTSKNVKTSLLATQRNPVCKNISGTHKNSRIKKDHTDVLFLDAPGFGNISLASLASSKVTTYFSDLNALHQDFLSADKIKSAKDTQPLDGAITSDFTLKPGQTKDVTFILTWYFPDANHGDSTEKYKATWNPQGNMYTNWFQSSSDILLYVKKNFDQLSASTHLFHDTLYQSNLPYWLKDRLSSQLAVLKSKTIFWAKNGYIGLWEGTSPDKGSCPGNCTHVWNYAQAHARLFPDFARNLKEIDFANQQPDGSIPHRQTPYHVPAIDGMCGIILASFREYQTSTDQQWLNSQWPKIKKAMDFVIAKWDPDENGILAGNQWNTLDGALSGSSSWMGSLYIAALDASQQMALIQNQPQLADHYRTIKIAAQKNQSDTLFNGRYFTQIIDKKNPAKDYGPGCHIDQLLGQWWARQLGLEDVYPDDRIKIALSSLFENNFNSDFYRRQQKPRKFVADNDAAMQMITWPLGGQPLQKNIMHYNSEVMSGFEYSAASAMIYSGLLNQGFSVLKAAHDRYDGQLRTGLCPNPAGPWGYSGNPFGDDECGKFYGRSLSIWSALLACQGFSYNGPKGLIGFDPVWQPENHVTFFTAARGYGLFKQSRSENRQIDSIELISGLLNLNSITLTLANNFKPSSISVQLDGKEIKSDHSINDRFVNIKLSKTLTLKQNDNLMVTFEMLK